MSRGKYKLTSAWDWECGIIKGKRKIDRRYGRLTIDGKGKNVVEIKINQKVGNDQRNLDNSIEESELMLGNFLKSDF